MDRPAGNSSTKEPESIPGEEPATAFFPDFATVRAALEAAQIAIWSWDLAANAVTWSSNVQSICGFSQAGFAGTFASFEHHIHEEDKARVLQAFDETRRTGSPFRLRYRVASRRGGDDIWIEATGTVTFKDGVPARMIGLCHDVTEPARV
jgi:PAS domain S-box-containing protein